MAKEIPNVGDLRRAGIISSTEIVAATDRYMQDPTMGLYRFASGHSIDIAAAIAAAPGMFELRKRPGPQEKTLRKAITAIVMSARAMPLATGNE
jgi:hypothetical protein